MVRAGHGFVCAGVQKNFPRGQKKMRKDRKKFSPQVFLKSDSYYRHSDGGGAAGRERTNRLGGLIDARENLGRAASAVIENLSLRRPLDHSRCSKTRHRLGPFRVESRKRRAVSKAFPVIDARQHRGMTGDAAFANMAAGVGGLPAAIFFLRPAACSLGMIFSTAGHEPHQRMAGPAARRAPRAADRHGLSPAATKSNLYLNRTTEFLKKCSPANASRPCPPSRSLC